MLHRAERRHRAADRSRRGRSRGALGNSGPLLWQTGNVERVDELLAAFERESIVAPPVRQRLEHGHGEPFAARLQDEEIGALEDVFLFAAADDASQCCFPDAERAGAGVTVENDVGAIAASMAALLADPAQLRAMGEAGRARAATALLRGSSSPPRPSSS